MNKFKYKFPYLRSEQGDAMLFALLLIPLLLILFAFLGDLAVEQILQTQIHYALETALDDAAQQMNTVAAAHSCVVLDPTLAAEAFQSGLMASLKSPGQVTGPGYWDFSPPAGNSSFTGLIEVDGFQVYNTNYLVQTSSSSYSCLTSSPPLGTTTPWGTVIDRPSVYADLLVPVVLPTGRRVTLDIFAVSGTNKP